MKVILFGATGMVGQGVLRECLLDASVESVLTVGRNPTGKEDPKLGEILQKNLTDYSAIERELTGFDACFFCLGISSLGMTEEDYTRVTYDIAVAAAKTLVRLNPGMTFIFVSGGGTDSSEKGPTMWARVKGRTENALLALPFRQSFMFRPAAIQPLHGVTSKTKSYRILYAVLWPVISLLRVAFPKYVTTTERVGRAMIRVAAQGYSKRVLENGDINEVARA